MRIPDVAYESEAEEEVAWQIEARIDLRGDREPAGPLPRLEGVGE